MIYVIEYSGSESCGKTAVSSADFAIRAMAGLKRAGYQVRWSIYRQGGVFVA